MRLCNLCNTEKDDSCFYRSIGRQCKLCTNKKNREYGKRNAKRLSAVQKTRRHENLGVYSATNHSYYEANKPKLLEKSVNWVANNKEASRIIKQRYKKAHPEVVRRGSHLRRARKYHCEGTYVLEDIAVLMKEQASHCFYCRETIEAYHEIDHIIPLSKQGSNSPSNIVLTCQFCNCVKHIRSVHNFIKHMFIRHKVLIAPMDMRKVAQAA